MSPHRIRQRRTHRPCCRPDDHMRRNDETSGDHRSPTRSTPFTHSPAAPHQQHPSAATPSPDCVPAVDSPPSSTDVPPARSTRDGGCCRAGLAQPASSTITTGGVKSERHTHQSSWNAVDNRSGKSTLNRSPPRGSSRRWANSRFVSHHRVAHLLEKQLPSMAVRHDAHRGLPPPSSRMTLLPFGS